MEFWQFLNFTKIDEKNMAWATEKTIQKICIGKPAENKEMKND